VTGLEQAGLGVRVQARTAAGERLYAGKKAILATGAAMPLLKNFGLMDKTPRVIRAVRGYFEVQRPLGERMEFRFDHVPLPGYGWLFPVSEQLVNAGLGYWPDGWRTNREVSLRVALEEFLGSPGLRGDFGELKPVGEVKSYPLRTDFASARTFGGDVLLVGEAAGLVNPLTGEGIDYALESGRIAGEFLAEHGLMADLAGYDARLRAAFQPIFRFSSRVQKVGMQAFSLDWLTRWAERRADLKRLLTNLMLGTMPLPERVSPAKVLRVLLGF
jgi:flavin-dependent dehydrogenase